MLTRKTAGFALASLALFACRARAATLFVDNFESYNAGQLATTDASTANPGPNGGPGNPWWAPFSGNGVITDSSSGVTPHSGNQMLAGAAAGDFDQNVVNIAHRFGGDATIKGNVALDFWFYDSNGAGDANSTGYGELGYYSNTPSNTDYNASHDLTSDGTIQRLVLGTVHNTGANLNFYQARVTGGTATVGTAYGTAGYINTTTARTVGWHEGRIVVGPNGNTVNFYVDDMNTPTGSYTTTLPNGLNTLILDTQEAGDASTINYFDDVTLSTTPEPTSAAALGAAATLFLNARRRKRLPGTP
jgi:hypothetical protein